MFGTLARFDNLTNQGKRYICVLVGSLYLMTVSHDNFCWEATVGNKTSHISVFAFSIANSFRSQRYGAKWAQYTREKRRQIGAEVN